MIYIPSCYAGIKVHGHVFKFLIKSMIGYFDTFMFILIWQFINKSNVVSRFQGQVILIHNFNIYR